MSRPPRIIVNQNRCPDILVAAVDDVAVTRPPIAAVPAKCCRHRVKK